MLWWTVQNLAIAAILSGVVWTVCRLCRIGPVGRHALWLLVLVKLLTPPLVVWPWGIQDPFAAPAASNAPDPVASESHPAAAPVAESGGDPTDMPADVPPAHNPDLVGKTGNPAEQPPIRAPIVPARHARTQWPLAAAGAAWICGAVVLVLIQFIRIARMWLRVGQAPPGDLELCRRVEELAARLGMRAPTVRRVVGIGAPLVWSLVRPELLWPLELSDTDFPGDSLRGLIVHELAHIKRRDHWIGWLELIAGCVWWWNPLFWYVRHQLRENAELACDAWVVQTLPTGRRAYAEALVAVCECFSRRAVAMPAVGVSTGGRGFLERRLAMILRERMPLRLPTMGLLAIALLAASALPAWSQKSPDADPRARSSERVDALADAYGRVNATSRGDLPLLDARAEGPDLASLREDVISRLRTLQEKYARAGQTEDAAAVAQCLRTLPNQPQSLRVLPDPGALMKYRGQVGRSYYFDVTGRTDQTIWGSGEYTDDSPLATAGVHAGVLREGRRGIVKVTLLPARSSYSGSVRNGVQSESWGPWEGSYRIESVDIALERPRKSNGVTDGDLVTLRDPGTLQTFRDRVGQSFTFDVVGSGEGTIWGSGVYTDDSPLSVAAVHAGILHPGERGRIRVTILPGSQSYESSNRNGITSQPYGPFAGSYRIDGLRRRLARTGGVAPTLEHLRDQVGRTFHVDITGSTEGQVWGSGIYTDDSWLPAAAVHAGVLRPGERGRIAVTILPGQQQYEGSTKNGVSSQPWTSWGGSYRIERATE